VSVGRQRVIEKATKSRLVRRTQGTAAPVEWNHPGWAFRQLGGVCHRKEEKDGGLGKRAGRGGRETDFQKPKADVR